jgi:hypothetical protein
MTKTDEAIPVIRTIDELPVVVALRAEVEKLKREKGEIAERCTTIAREGDARYAAEKMALRQQVLDLQNEIVRLQDKILAVRQAVL